MLRTLSVPSLALMLGAALWVAACDQIVPATEVVVGVRSNLKLGEEIDAIEVRLLEPDDWENESAPSRRYSLSSAPSAGEYELPLSFSVAPGKRGSKQPFRLVVTGMLGDRPVVEQQVIATFVPRKSLLLELFLARNCLDQLCRSEDRRTNQTCEATSGTCQETEQKADLPIWPGPGSELEGGVAVDEPVDPMDGEVTQQDAGAPDTGSRMDGGLADGSPEAGPTQPMCSTGFEVRDGSCGDIDECSKNPSLCGAAQCNNRDGGYACGDCATGFAPNSSGACVDINECTVSADNCDDHADCHNTAGTFECACRAGDGYTGNGTACGDLDECADGTLNDCDTEPPACANRSPVAGRFTCVCPSGYEGNGIGANGCRDVNECTTGVFPCDTDPPTTCGNTIGGFSCSCPAGFAGDGRSAQGCVPKLSDLKLFSGTTTLTFDPLVTDYTATVLLGVPNAIISAAAQNGHTLRIDGVDVTSGQLFSQPLALGLNQVQVVVSAGGASRTYTLNLTRGASVQDYFKASNSSAESLFGYSIALSGDGLTLAVGTPGEDSGARGIGLRPNPAVIDSGAVYVFRKTGNVWAEEAALKAPNTEQDDNFGFSVGLNADGNLLAVGATGEETAPDAAQNSGAVYVYRRTGNTWAEDGYLKASNPGADDSFGERVTVSADGLRVAVGATAEDSSIGGINSVPNDSSASTGAVYVFRHGETGWSEEAYVKPLSTISNDLFGSSISLSADGSVLAIGADSDVSMTLSPGRAYVFRRTGSVWTEEATLFARDKGPADYFGDSLSLSADGNTLAVGAPGEDSATSGVNSTPNEGATGSGSAYLFRRSAGVWTQEVYFKADNVGANDGFGDSVSLSADGRILAIGAAGEKSTTSGINSTSNDLGGFVGAVYVFRQSDTTWAQIAYVKASSPGSNDRFSFNWLALSADGTTMAVPSQGEASSTRGVNTVPNDFAARTGAAYVFH